jgi:hypothetical protein
VHCRQLSQRLDSLLATFAVAPGRAVAAPPNAAGKWEVLTRPHSRAAGRL